MSDTMLPLNPEQMKSAAAALDSSSDGVVDIPESSASGSPKAPKSEGKPEDKSAGTDAPQGEVSPDKSDAPTKGKPDDQGKPKEPSTPDPKTGKEQERQDRSWKALEEEKAKFYAERDEFQKSKAEFEAQRASAPKSAGNYTADEYEAAAKKFEEEGETKLAEQARAAAKQVREEQARATETSKKHQEEFLTKWRANIEILKAEHPDLGKDGTALATEVRTLLQHPAFSMSPDGIKDAVQVAKWKLAAAEADKHRARVEELEKEVKTLRESVEIPPSGGYSRPASSKKFENMSPEEQKEELRRRAEELDASGT